MLSGPRLSLPDNCFISPPDCRTVETRVTTLASRAGRQLIRTRNTEINPSQAAAGQQLVIRPVEGVFCLLTLALIEQNTGPANWPLTEIEIGVFELNWSVPSVWRGGAGCGCCAVRPAGQGRPGRRWALPATNHSNDLSHWDLSNKQNEAITAQSAAAACTRAWRCPHSAR